MEKTLGELETIWAEMKFDTTHHDSSGQTLLVARDELIEQLEGDQVISITHGQLNGNSKLNQKL